MKMLPLACCAVSLGFAGACRTGGAGPAGEGAAAIPRPLDDEWGRWLVGEWEGAADTAYGKSKERLEVSFGLGGQFLTIRYRSEIAEMSAEQENRARSLLGVSGRDVPKVKIQPFERLELHTTDPRTGSIIAHSFDSWRTIIAGTGRREGNRETVEWSTASGTSARAIEKLGEDRMRLTDTWRLPDGREMEESMEMTRVKAGTKEAEPAGGPRGGSP